MSRHEARKVSDPDEVNGADDRPTRSSGLVLAGLLGGVVLAAVLIGQLAAPESPPRPATAVAPTTTSNLPRTPEPETSTGEEPPKRCPMERGGLTLGHPLQVPGLAIDRWDCDALTRGPWSVVIRAPDGRFGVKGAVVTFPKRWIWGRTPHPEAVKSGSAS
jgi:hypothetical protein